MAPSARLGPTGFALPSGMAAVASMPLPVAIEAPPPCPPGALTDAVTPEPIALTAPIAAASGAAAVADAMLPDPTELPDDPPLGAVAVAEPIAPEAADAPDAVASGADALEDGIDPAAVFTASPLGATDAADAPVPDATNASVSSTWNSTQPLPSLYCSVYVPLFSFAKISPLGNTVNPFVSSKRTASPGRGVPSKLMAFRIEFGPVYSGATSVTSPNTNAVALGAVVVTATPSPAAPTTC